jgi:hypothetical protein
MKGAKYMDISTLPGWEQRYFSRWLYQATLSYFENPDVQERFNKWKAERNAQNSEEGADE